MVPTLVSQVGPVREIGAVKPPNKARRVEVSSKGRQLLKVDKKGKGKETAIPLKKVGESVQSDLQNSEPLDDHLLRSSHNTSNDDNDSSSDNASSSQGYSNGHDTATHDS